MAEKKYVIDNAELMAEWNWEKNNELHFDPKTLTLGSGQKVWWKCIKGHMWQATICNIANGRGCPYCSGKKVLKGYNDLQTVNPILAKEWNYEKNGELKPENFSANSTEKVWWKCEKKHEWQATINNRNNGRGCPYCSSKKILKGYNDLQTANPIVSKEWNYQKNNGLTPENVTPNSSKKVWWKCAKGHEWQARVDSRNNGNGCPYCSGLFVVKGENDLPTIVPTLAKEWNYEKNGNLKPEYFAANSNKKVWWKCSKGHEWQATINSRNKGNGCPYCSGRYTVKGENDLQTVNPILAKEWNYEKNGNLNPESFLANSHEKVWWKCAKGHEWQATIGSRNTGIGCPYCSGRYTVKGENDLQTVNPILAKEWNYEKNGGLKPENIMANSNITVWWKCHKGHEWRAKISNRNNGRGCPICNSERNTSFPEYALVYYLEKYGLEVVHSYREKGYELDVYIPLIKTAIEYDGYYWHKNKAEKDLEKNQKCKKDGIKLYRIRENLPKLNDSSIDYVVRKDQKDLPKILEEVLSEITRTSVDVNLERDTIAIDNLREYTEKANSLLFSNPQVAKEWNYEKNGNLKPEHFAANSNKKVWWKCEKGHEWQAAIYHRNKGRGCPICAKEKRKKKIEI
ncbi:MAG: hypothetical protein IJP21_04195 [Clostridia bacterium]|nr:hypothetical protein [Clostridia bacterium]